PWRFLLCRSCGSCGTHELYSAISSDTESWECSDCSGKKRSTGTGSPQTRPRSECRLIPFCCPLCRDMETFQAEMRKLGIKIPNRDAAWEDEESFLELSQRHSTCDTNVCLCPQGREHSENMGPWRFLLCRSCGSCGTHELCSAISSDTESWECSVCSGKKRSTGTGSPQTRGHTSSGDVLLV
ncbi:hypothetical protein ASZ78_007052, partial [Callipepla squamata]